MGPSDNIEYFPNPRLNYIKVSPSYKQKEQNVTTKTLAATIYVFPISISVKSEINLKVISPHVGT